MREIYNEDFDFEDQSGRKVVAVGTANYFPASCATTMAPTRFVCLPRNMYVEPKVPEKQKALVLAENCLLYMLALFTFFYFNNILFCRSVRLKKKLHILYII